MQRNHECRNAIDLEPSRQLGQVAADCHTASEVPELFSGFAGMTLHMPYGIYQLEAAELRKLGIRINGYLPGCCHHYY
jgi:hypothetical protein